MIPLQYRRLLKIICLNRSTIILSSSLAQKAEWFEPLEKRAASLASITQRSKINEPIKLHSSDTRKQPVQPNEQQNDSSEVSTDILCLQ